eukprot:c27768_g1_i1 orf=489-2204(-)
MASGSSCLHACRPFAFVHPDTRRSAYASCAFYLSPRGWNRGKMRGGFEQGTRQPIAAFLYPAPKKNLTRDFGFAPFRCRIPVSRCNGLVLDRRKGMIYRGSRRRNGLLIRCRVEGAEILVSALKFGKRIETDSLPPDIRDRTMSAVDDLGGRVTVGDVASKAGLKLSQAEMALQALASDVGGFLEVSGEGDVLYVLPKDYRSNLAAKSLRMKIEPILTKLKVAADYLIRVSFGTALLTSIVIVYGTILVLLTSGKSEEDNRGGRGGYSTSQRSRSSGFTFYINPSDLLWYWDPYYYRRTRAKEGGLNFFESVFSFVFGDGDPNEGSEELRWKMIGEYIISKGGVVLAEELAPFLDVPTLSENEDDESFVLPVLLRFDGQPEVDQKGNILYRFPSLQRTASGWSRRRSDRVEKIQSFKEKHWTFSKAGKMELSLVIALGGVNLVGVILLSSLLRDFSIVGQFGGSLVPFVAKLLPILQVYTASFFVIPAIRWFLLQRRNVDIDSRNTARQEWASILEYPDSKLKAKLQSAEDMSKEIVIGPEEIIYTTEKDLDDQDYDVREWEKKFKEQESR